MRRAERAMAACPPGLDHEQQAARIPGLALARPGEEDMAAKPIVVGTDGSAQSLQAVEWAAREAGLRDPALRIVAVPALPPLMSRH